MKLTQPTRSTRTWLALSKAKHDQLRKELEAESRMNLSARKAFLTMAVSSFLICWIAWVMLK